MSLTIATAVYISVDKHREQIQQCMESIKTTHNIVNKIAVVNNLRDTDDLLTVYQHFDTIVDNKVNNVSRAWNKAIQLSFDHFKSDYCLIINHDILFRDDTIDTLIRAARKHPHYLMWSSTPIDSHDPGNSLKGFFEWKILKSDPRMGSDSHLSCFLVDKRLFKTVGEFDELFDPAYFEDNDIAYRIRLSGNKSCKIDQSLFWHWGSQTIFQDKKYAAFNNVAFPKNAKRYQKKWGGAPGQEKYTKPFNKNELELKNTKQNINEQ